MSKSHGERDSVAVMRERIAVLESENLQLRDLLQQHPVRAGELLPPAGGKLSAQAILDFHVQNLPLGYLEWDGQFTIRRWSSRAEEIFGWSAAEVLGKQPQEWHFIFEEDSQEVFQLIQELISGSCRYGVMLNRNYTRSGELRWIQWFNSVLVDEESGKLISGFSYMQDVTDRIEAEQRLRQNEERYRHLAEHLPGVLYLCRDAPPFPMLFINDAVRRVTGYGRDAFLSGACDFVALYHPDDRDRVILAVRQAIAARRPFFLRYRLRHRSGEWRWIEESGQGIRDGLIEGFLRDVTAEYHAMQMLTGGRRVLELEATSEPMAKILGEVNRLAEELLPGSRSAVYALETERGTLGRIVGPALAEPEGQAALARLAGAAEIRRAAEVASTQRKPMALENLRIAGERDGAWMHGWAFAIADRRRGVIGVLLLHTAEVGPLPGDAIQEMQALAGLAALAMTRRQQEEQLRDVNEQLERRVAQRTAELEALNHQHLEQASMLDSILNASADLIFLFDAQGICRYASRAIFSACAFTSEQLIGLRLDEMALPANVMTALETQRQHVATNRQAHRTTFFLDLPDGRHTYEATFQPVFGSTADGPVPCICSARDITDALLAEQATLRHLAELAHVSRLSTMGEMASGIAHELNQPLAAMSIYAQGCLRRLDDGRLDDASCRTALEKIHVQATRAGEIIRRLRRFVAKRDPRRETTDLNLLVIDVIELLAHDADRLGVTFAFDPTPSLPQILADTIQIEQVVLNLIRNAMEASEPPAPGVEERPVVTIRTLMAGADRLEIRVIDHGSGMDQATLDHVFDPFFTTKSGGMGMGLTISASIAEMHGGRILAERNPAGGMIFRFQLPLGGDPAAAVPGD